MKHILMTNNITQKDNLRVANFLKTNPILTNNKKVREFEKQWSKWLGTKYSVFVNSGSSANLLSISYLRTLYKDGEIIVPALTWVSDVTSILYCNFKPVFIDINLNNLGANFELIKKAINKKTRAVFLTHVLGLNCLSKELLTLLKKKNIMLIEDVCESHGATFNKKKLGTFGEISNFSFYYAHHMSTVEGGMVSTNNKEIYEKMRIMRSHGMLRESLDQKMKLNFYKKYPKVNKEFFFAYPGYNFRSTEINAVYGLSQIKRLSNNNKKRIRNFEYFIKNLSNEKYFTKFNMIGSCNYALIIIFEKAFRNFSFRVKFETKLKKNNIEFRRGLAGGGNQARQPYLSLFKKKYKILGKLSNTDIIHDFGYYIGNYPSLKKSKILNICRLLNEI